VTKLDPVAQCKELKEKIAWKGKDDAEKADLKTLLLNVDYLADINNALDDNETKTLTGADALKFAKWLAFKQGYNKEISKEISKGTWTKKQLYEMFAKDKETVLEHIKALKSPAEDFKEAFKRKDFIDGLKCDKMAMTVDEAGQKTLMQQVHAAFQTLGMLGTCADKSVTVTVVTETVWKIAEMVLDIFTGGIWAIVKAAVWAIKAAWYLGRAIATKDDEGEKKSLFYGKVVGNLVHIVTTFFPLVGRKKKSSKKKSTKKKVLRRRRKLF